MDLNLKAELLKNNGIFVENIRLKHPYVSRDNSGPGQGRKSIFLKIGENLVRTPLSKRRDYILSGEEDRIILKKGDEVLSHNVEILPVGIHCPGQAFLNIYGRCVYKCSFCSCWRHKKNDMNLQRTIAYLERIEGRIEGIALTSAVENGIRETNDVMLAWLKELKNFELPVGVETVVAEKGEIDAFFSHGADEIKINIQASTEELYKKINAPLSYNRVKAMLEHAVEVFGRGKVASNLICGLGEKMDDIVECMEELCGMGVSLNLRFLRPPDDSPIEIPKESMIYLASELKKIYRKYGLHPRTFKTMCHKCTACDIVPYVDI